MNPSASSTSLVWFTLARGVLSEVFWARIDRPCTRDLTLLVADGEGLVGDESVDCEHAVAYLEDAALAYRLTNTARNGRYRITKTIITHPDHGAVLQRIRFEPTTGSPGDWMLFVVLNPHLGGQGSDNSGWVGDHAGVPMLFARRDSNALALASSAPWVARSAGFLGKSDGRTDLRKHGRMTWRYDRAARGNVVLTGQIDLAACGGEFTLALGFGFDAPEAGHCARASLLDPFDRLQERYVQGWRDWQSMIRPPRSSTGNGRDQYRLSASVLRVHQSETVSGATIASFSIPWGEAKEEDSPESRGGYHLVWPRDLAMIAGGLAALDDLDGARRGLDYLRASQQGDGHWPQNMWVSGAVHRDGLQLGETAIALLLLDLLHRQGGLRGDDLPGYWPMARSAAGYILRNGPATQQDRWENTEGYTTFTLGIAIAALLVAAEQAERAGESGLAGFLREAADAWNADLETWLYVTGTKTAREVGVPGYYVRIVPPHACGSMMPNLERIARSGDVPIQRDGGVPVTEVVSPDALALVRFGLRAPDDPKIRNTVRVVDAITKVETPFGPAWHRYNGDGYGEHADGSPLADLADRGIGRAWPLLTGERGHFELAAGRIDEAARLLAAMEAFAGPGGLIPEQVWDSEDIPLRGLYLGRPTGSAMPLAWAHAEYVKLRRSIEDGALFDLPPQTVTRYLVERTGSRVAPWRPEHRRPTFRPGAVLRIETQGPASVRWWVEGDDRPRQSDSSDTGLGLHWIDLPTDRLAPGRSVRFRFLQPEDQPWSGTDFEVIAEEAPDR